MSKKACLYLLITVFMGLLSCSDGHKEAQKIAEANKRLSEQHFNTALELYNKAMYAEAISELDKAISLYPKIADAYYWRGRAHLFTNNMDKALSDFKHATYLDEFHAGAFENLGYINYLGGDYDESMKSLNTALELNPDSGLSYYIRANIKSTQKDFSGAIKDSALSCVKGYKEGCKLKERLSRSSSQKG